MSSNHRIQIIKKSVVGDSSMLKYIFFLMLELRRRSRVSREKKVFKKDAVRSYPFFEHFDLKLAEFTACIQDLSNGFEVLDDLYSADDYHGYAPIIREQLFCILTWVGVNGYGSIQAGRLERYIRDLAEALQEVSESGSIDDLTYSLTELHDLVEDYLHSMPHLAGKYYQGLEDLCP